MSETDEQTLTSAELFDVLKRLCGDYVLSDLRLLSDSLNQLRNPDILGTPYVVNAPVMDARLGFDSSVSKEKKILFGLRRRKREERIAEFDVRMKLTPAPDADIVPPGPVQIYGSWPQFVESVRSTGSMIVTLDEADSLRINLPTQGGIEAATIRARSLTHRFDSLPPRIMVSMISAIARWTRNNKSSEPMPLTGRMTTSLDTFLEMLTTKVGELLQDTADIFRPEGPGTADNQNLHKQRIVKYRDRIASMIGPGYCAYRFADFSGRLKFVLDEEGGLATDPFSKDNRRFDVDAHLAKIDNRSGLVVSLNIPDLLVSGALFDQILDALIQSDALSELVEKMDGLTDFAFSHKALKDCFRDAKTSRHSVVARIERPRSGEDLNLILVRGGPPLSDSWLLFTFRISFDGRESGTLAVKEISKLRLAALASRDTEWLGHKEDQKVLGAYLYRAFLTFYGWRMRFWQPGADQQ